MVGCAILFLAASYHMNTAFNYNQTHPSAGVACEQFSAGVYKNSLRNTSVWAAKRDYYGGRLYTEYGLVTGYQYRIVPLVRVGYDLGYVEFFAAPSIETHRDGSIRPIGVLGAQLKIPLR